MDEPTTERNANRNPVRILIVEEALRSAKGHWPEYIRTIADACRKAGDEVTVLAHSEATEEVITGLRATPLLPYSAWDGIYNSSNPAMRYGGALLHNRRLYRSVAAYLAESEKFDCILAPTVLIHHLLAWGQIARRFAGRKFDRLALIFVNGQGIYQGPGRPAAFPRHPKRMIFRKGLQVFRPFVMRGEVILGAETDAMAREYETFCGLTFHRFPHPVDFPETEDAHPSLETPVLSCLGFARHEKGSDLLQEAIVEIRRRRPDLQARFVIQWLDDFRDTRGELVEKDPVLLRDPNIEYITEPIDRERYLEELRRTTAMLLPYRASSYYSRVSRVAIEAAIMGIPMLYTRHTWLEEMTARCGAGVGFEDESREDLISKIIFLIENIRALKLRAMERRQLARETYSATAFRETLLAELETGRDGKPRATLARTAPVHSAS